MEIINIFEDKYGKFFGSLVMQGADVIEFVFDADNKRNVIELLEGNGYSDRYLLMDYKWDEDNGLYLLVSMKII